MDRTRRNARLIAVVSLVATLISGVIMARRISSFHRDNPREVFAFYAVSKPEFSYRGRPVTLTNDLTDPANPVLVVDYGGAVERVNVSIPGNFKLPDLIPHDDWMRILCFAPAQGLSPEQFVEKIRSPDFEYRLVMVTRTPRPGTDPKTWGSVWKKDWVFDFFEFMPDGTILKHPRLKYPTTRGVRKPKEGELHENTWEFQAALQLMPQAGGVGPTHNFFGNAMAAAGWTLPLGAFAGLVCTVALAFSFAPSRRSAPA
jgi:hypothetical protein